MSTVVVGSVAIVSVKARGKEAKTVLGGSAVYLSYSASFFTDVKMVGVVGNDFPEEYYNLLKSRNIDLEGLFLADGKTFRWSGEYSGDMNSAKTLETQLNVFENFEPYIPETYKNCEVLFLANIDPELQLMVLDQMETPDFVACDTMNLWISVKKGELKKLLKKVDLFIVNDMEAKMITSMENTIDAASKLLEYGPTYIIVKKGEHGVLFASHSEIAVHPAYPTKDVIDPTGAGDSFAGGLIGMIDKMKSYDFLSIKKALPFGVVMSSFAIEDFSLNGLTKLSSEDIIRRYEKYCKIITPERV